MRVRLFGVFVAMGLLSVFAYAQPQTQLIYMASTPPVGTCPATTPPPLIVSTVTNPGIYQCISNSWVRIAGSGTSVMTWPSSAGIAVYSGSSTWSTSLTAPNGSIVGTTDTQTLTNKTVDGITPTLFGYLSNISSDVQTQLNGKQAALTNPVTASGTSGTSGTLATCENTACTSVDASNYSAATLAIRAFGASIGDGVNAMTAASYLLNGRGRNDYGKTFTISTISCMADNSGTTAVSVANSAGTALLTSSITLSTANTWISGTLGTTTTMASGDWTNWTITADGTSTQVICDVKGTI